MTKIISLAYSPDTDDAFMALAMRERRIPLGDYEFVYTTADIQTLNEAALRGVYDVTAISIAAYPEIAATYWLMPVGASVSEAEGPAVVVRDDSPVSSVEELRGKRVAVPGTRTSAFVAARTVIGEFVEVPIPFDRIADAVQSGAVDGGILIHELQLDATRVGLRPIGHLGTLWTRAKRLPLPLGGNAIRRSLGPEVIADVTAIMRASIEAGLADRKATLERAMAKATPCARATMTLADGDEYISRYVNHRSLAFDADARLAVATLFRAGGDQGLIPVCDADAAFYE
jgi:1,4-dihydroxy-6-naphthoate synthase